MDTRQKIAASAAGVPGASKRKVIAGYFDPVTSAHVRRLKEMVKSGVQTVVIVLDPPDPLLSLRARAEIVAALNAVDYVLISDDNSLQAALVELAPDEVVQEEAADIERRRTLIEHVLARQSGDR